MARGHALEHLLSINDALEDFDSCEYALKTNVELRIGTQAKTWQLLLNPPSFPGSDGQAKVLAQLRRWTDFDEEEEAELQYDFEEGDEIASFAELWEPDLLAIAEAYGIDPEERMWELEWAVLPHATTIARARDPRWPNTNTAED